MDTTIERNSNRFVLLYEAHQQTDKDLETEKEEWCLYDDNYMITAHIIKQENTKIHMNVNSNYNIVSDVGFSQTKRLNIPKWEAVTDIEIKKTIIREVFKITASRIIKAINKYKIPLGKHITQDIIIFSKTDEIAKRNIIYYSVHGDFLNILLSIFDIKEIDTSNNLKT